MLIVLSKKTPPKFEKCLLVYLYRIHTGIYVGDVTIRVLDYLKEEIPKHIGRGYVRLIWKNSLSPRGFDYFEFSGDGVNKYILLDGLEFPII
jgi:hypothetical protein